VNRPPRAPRRRVDGILLLDKPAGITSNAALQRARRVLQAEKAGHTGTLDPLASGLLPLCFGDATKFAQQLLDARKEYLATVVLGRSTTTGDAEGETVAQAPVACGQDDVLGVLPRFLGRIQQTPPRYAALKRDGRAWYEYARAGIEIERAPRPVVIDALEVVGFAPPTVTLRVACGKGTYVRVLAEDIGAALGVPAHLGALRRTVAGPFGLAAAVGLDALEAGGDAEAQARLLPIDAALDALPRLELGPDDVEALRQGRRLPAGDIDPGSYRGYVVGAGFAGVVIAADGVLRPGRMARPLALPVGG
jgi:tRNA pseudouridine55 synthase